MADEAKFPRCIRPGCGLSFATLDLTIDVQKLKDLEKIDAKGIHLSCPACGQENSTDLKDYDFFQQDGQFYRWRSSPTKIEIKGDIYKLRIGSLTLDFPDSLVADAKFDLEAICYEAVPVFSAKGGKTLIVPTLPVQARFLKLIDTTKEIKSELIGKKECKFQFYLKVANDRKEITLPLIPVQPDRAAEGENAIFNGVNLTLWPRMLYQEWRRYFLRFGSTKDGITSLSNSYRDVKISALALDTTDTNATEPDWVLVNTMAPDKFTRLGCFDSRPEWIAIEFENKARPDKFIGGGLWMIPRAAAAYPDGVSKIGVDFGTSNTCIAWDTGERLGLLPIESLDDPIIDGSPLPDVLHVPDIWPPRHGFGKNNKSLLPTEILTRQPISELRSRANEVVNWKPVLDYTIPSGGLGVRYKEQDYVLAEFKWQRMIADEAFQRQYQELQKRYLELLLLYALAALAQEGRTALYNSLTVNFSYPLAFRPNEEEEFRKMLPEVAKAVSAQTGVEISIVLSIDEARAAAKQAGGLGSKDDACLYVDIGGGSTDIALLKLDSGNPKEYSYICSFQYAGSGLASALVDGGCLRPGSDISDFRRQIREVNSVEELMDTEILFLQKMHSAITGKSSYFFAYLRQFLARLLAAHILTGEWEEGLTEDTKEQIREEGYKVLLFPLGNGWGFGHFIAREESYEQVFSGRLKREANEIIQDAIERKIEIKGKPLPERLPRVVVAAKQVSNPKSAVAIGLLSREQESIVKRPWRLRTIVGWTTEVGRRLKIDWFNPIIGPAEPPDGLPELPPGSRLDCPEKEWPAFPQNLPTPHFWDPELNETLDYLKSECSPDTGQYWFKESPFHVLLERTFKKALKKAL